MTRTRTPREHDSMPHGTLLGYTVGFVLSIVLTFAAFWLTPHFGALIIPAIIGLALIQVLIQLVFFLHIGRGTAAQANVFVLSFTLLIIGILVGGTLWIMHNLEHLHMPAATESNLYEHGVAAPQNELY